MPDPLGHFDDITRILVRVHPRTVWLREREIEERDDRYGSLSLALGYPDGSRLYVELEADCSGELVRWPIYGFQYLGPDGTERFRYDNAPHHPEIATHLHHKHLNRLFPIICPLPQEE